MAKRLTPSLEDTGIPRARKGEAAPSVLDAAPEKSVHTPTFLRPGDKPQGGAGELNVHRPQQEAFAAPEADFGDALDPVPEATSSPTLTARPDPDAAPAEAVKAGLAGRVSVRLMPRKAQARGEPRSPVTTRLTYAIQDRLFAAATQLCQTQQAIIEAAIDEHLARHGL